jgi:hypothetical protein
MALLSSGRCLKKEIATRFSVSLRQALREQLLGLRAD